MSACAKSRQQMRRRLAVLGIAVALATAVVGCSTGADAVAQGGTFQFVAPGGKTDIYYDPPESRGRPGKLAGPSLLDSGNASDHSVGGPVLDGSMQRFCDLGKVHRTVPSAGGAASDCNGGR